MITNFKIKNLFGQFDYELDFTNLDGEKIKFLTGPNGYGKTTILSMISALFSRNTQDYKVFIETPFEKINVQFDGAELTIQKDENVSESIDESDKIISFVFKPNVNSEPIEMSLQFDKGNITLENSSIFQLFILSRNCYYLTDQRQFSKQSDGMNSINAFDDWTIKKDSRKFVELLREYISENNDNFSFGTPRNIEQNEYEIKKQEINQFIERLNYYKFYPKPFHLNLPQYTANASIILGGIIDDAQQKLEKYRPLVEKLDLLCKIVEDCQPVNKIFRIEAKSGFKLWSLLKSSRMDVLPLEKLSSGEKQLLIQGFELIFLAKEGSVVLIDEPETSYHVAWQMNYYENLKKIAKQKNLQCIVATHSPEIFNGNWTKSIDLFECANKSGVHG
jgi:predicted ATP-binding protein involved in virulence